MRESLELDGRQPHHLHGDHYAFQFRNGGASYFSGFSDVELEFSYHMYGTGMGTLALEASQTGYAGPWTKVLSLSGDQGNSWRVYTIDLSAYAGQTNVMLRFSAKTGSSYTSDISIDNIKITTVK